MSSREIAELTGKQHFNVLSDIRLMLAGLGIDALEFEGVYLAGNGEHRPMYNLPKRETLILVSGYNLQMRARIIDRWQELEAQVAATPALTNSQIMAQALLIANSELSDAREVITANTPAPHRSKTALLRAGIPIYIIATCRTNAISAPQQLFPVFHEFLKAGIQQFIEFHIPV